jgi:lipoyl-dependent peroxiredoxin
LHDPNFTILNIQTMPTQHTTKDAAPKNEVIIRSATANWSGGLKSGKGTIDTESNVLQRVPYSYELRFENGKKGTNPEELLAAAHAACFTMAVAAHLDKKGINPTSLHTKAAVNMEGLAIKSVHLSITGSAHGTDETEFKNIVDGAAQNCIMSKALSVPVTAESHFTT